jgi:hypothetical protein
MNDDAGELERFEAVYYPQQVPRSLETLTFLGFLFDKVYFPGVYLPPVDQIDIPAVRAEVERIKKFLPSSIEDIQLVQCMSFSTVRQFVDDFCVFGCKVPEKISALANTIEEMVYGPPKEGFIPILTSACIKALPGGDPAVAQVNFPGAFHYPAGALLFSAEHGIPVINDTPQLPIPGVPGDAKANAKLLAMIMAMEAIRMVLPKIKALRPDALREFRQETAQYVRPFRLAMLRLARDLNAALSSDAPLAEVQQQAKFLAETTIYPTLRELDAEITNPAKPWYRRAVDLARSAPELAASFLTLPKHLAWAKVLGEVAKTLADLRDDQLDKEHKLERSGLHYLLRLKETV